MKIKIGAICLLLSLTGLTESSSEVQAQNPGSCHENTKACIQRMNQQISVVRAYVTRLKPGDSVTFNPQPDPPGDPNPWFRKANESYRNLERELADLSSFPPGPCKNECLNSIKDTQAKLHILGRTTDRNSANFGLRSLSISLQKLSSAMGKRGIH